MNWSLRAPGGCWPRAEAEVDAYVSGLVDEIDKHGERLAVRNGHAEARQVVTGAGPVEVRAPRGNDRRVDDATGQRRRFRSSLIPRSARKSPKSFGAG